MKRLAVLLASIAWSVAGCGIIGQLSGAREVEAFPYPGGCAEYGMSTRRCDAVVAEAKRRAGLDDAAIATIELTSEPPCSSDPNQLCAYTTSFAANVRLHLADGRTHDEQIRCSIGGAYDQLCTDTPAVRLGGAVLDGSGYRDVPCAGEAPDGCATPLPTIAPTAAADARPLEVPILDIPIDHLGAYHVDVGEAVLPNGILTSARLELADPTDPMLSIDPDSGLALVVESLLPDGRPFVNYYDHGWRTGTEPVRVSLDFVVTDFAPGAVLRILDLAVR